jgi:Uma2 family endonuclease
VALDRWQALSAEQRNGARLGWLLIPAERAVEIWEPMAEIPAPPQRIEAASRLDADPEFPGLAVDLEEIWRAKAGLPSPDQGVRMGAP